MYITGITRCGLSVHFCVFRYRYETAQENTFKRERNFDNERITFKKFFNQTKEKYVRLLNDDATVDV